MHKNNDHRFAHQLINKYHDSDTSMCIIVKDSKEARLINNELSLYLNSENINYFPENEILPYDHFSTPDNILSDRFSILNSLEKEKKIIITTIKSLFELYPTKDFFQSKKTFNLDDSLSLNKLEEILISLNYEKVNRIDGINQYSLRGGIIDIYTPIYRNPLRIEIFDNSIESIRFFDLETQSSIKKSNNFRLSKSSLYTFNDHDLKIFRDNWREYFQEYDERHCEIFQNLNTSSKAEGSDIYLPLFFSKTSNFFEIFDSHSFVVLDNFDDQIDTYNKYIQQRFDDENIDSQRPLLLPSDLFCSLEIIKNELPQESTWDFGIYEDFNYKDINEILNDINLGKLAKYKIVLITSIQSEYEALFNKFKPNIREIKNISEASFGINLIISNIVRPIHIKEKLIIFNNEYKHDSNLLFLETQERKSITHNRDQLFNDGDYVVHENYGIGIYEGLEVVETNNNSNEYMKIMYSTNEALYVPLRSVDLISKYHKNDLTENIKLDSLSSNKWLKNKEKAQKRAYDHAAEILDIESRRLESTAFVLRANDKDLNIFNKDFPFKETADQLEAISAIQKDIALVKPMNRVLCGDVGFGKTEVAMRSAFVSINSDKQVVLLCPSTVLSEQHYESFLERFKNTGASIKLINRHTSKKNKDSYVKGFNDKNIDIVIGTHALFTCGINFSNTGILIVDEEHKFGIRQKDLIKGKQENIHILYLSATPIPRTMNFIFSGLKEFSFLHTPPSNRLSIKSFLKIETNQLFKEAISREISRGGQCFIVQNNINKMNLLKNQLNKLLPDIKIDIAHGKLKKDDISNVMRSFDTGSLDVLICTTIVEMGLDIPNANTMLIIDSQNFGLSQLHQLRGRVGRSAKQGYCYFLTPSPNLSKIAKNRLDSIIKLCNLGSGFFIAQEDLEIRGGGEMLGEKQSGHINTIGMSLYLSMLKNSIDILKNNDEKEFINTEINFYDSSYINDSYLPSPVERLKIYKNLSNATSIEDIDKISVDLRDRCGLFTNEVQNLIDDSKLLVMIRNTGIISIKSNTNRTSILLSSSIRKKVFDKILTMIQINPTIYSINQENKFLIEINEKDTSIRRNTIMNLINEIT
jgi:transcription-repair coupling factor (superfamily II helicase)